MIAPLTLGSITELRGSLGLLPSMDDSTLSTDESISADNPVIPTPYQDAVFICIDTEGDPAREFGISILDTRDLKTVQSTSEARSKPLISTFNYQLQRNPRAEFERPFQFGTSRMIDAASVYQLLQKVCLTGHPDASHQEPRNTILVGHSVDADMAILQRTTRMYCGYPFVHSFDTQILHRDMFGGPNHRKLEQLLIKLKTPYKYLHNGGNDSNFTLKALLALALRDCPVNRDCDPELKMRKQIVRVIAEMEMPKRIPDHLEPIPFDALIVSDVH